MEHRAAAVMEVTAVRTSSIRLHTVANVVPYALALFFLFWSLRDVGAGNLVDTDAARHALNGAFIHDLVKSGTLAHPYEFGLNYYARLPALSMPYHPPLFPAIEGLFYFIFGVHVFTARLAIAMSVAITVWLLLQLIRATQQSLLLAVAATASFCFWQPAQAVAGDVMLEYPAMAFTIAALWCIRDLSSGFPLRRGIMFALLAGAAVWTKQHAVFLAGVPFAYILFSGSWRLLRNKTLWISSVLLIAEIAALMMLSMPFKGAGVNQVSPIEESGSIFLYNLGYYRDCVRDSVGVVIPVITIVTILAGGYVTRLRPKQNSSLPFYWAWACCGFGILLLIGPYDIRYLFFALPPVLVIVYESLDRIGAAAFGDTRAWVLPAALLAVCAVMGLRTPAVFMHGPAEAATMIVNDTPQVVFYCGSTDGNFIFSVRERDLRFRTAVISGEKLPPASTSPAGFEQLAHKYGISRIVIERSTRAQVCDALRQSPTASMALEREIPLTSSNPRWQGSLMVYRFLNPSRRSDGKLVVPVEKIGRDLVLNLN